MNNINDYLKYVAINGNIRSVCNDCIDKKYTEFREKNGVLNLLISCSKSKIVFIKSKFVDNDEIEHMWVKVTSLVDKDNTIIIRGVLDNEPVLVNNVSCGDTVEISLDNICNFIADSVPFMPLV